MIKPVFGRGRGNYSYSKRNVVQMVGIGPFSKRN